VAGVQQEGDLDEGLLGFLGGCGGLRCVRAQRGNERERGGQFDRACFGVHRMGLVLVGEDVKFVKRMVENEWDLGLVAQVAATARRRAFLAIQTARSCPARDTAARRVLWRRTRSTQES